MRNSFGQGEYPGLTRSPPLLGYRNEQLPPIPGDGDRAEPAETSVTTNKTVENNEVPSLDEAMREAGLL